MSDIKVLEIEVDETTLPTNRRVASPLPGVGALRTLHVDSLPQSRSGKSWSHQTLPLQGRALRETPDLQLWRLLVVRRPQKAVDWGVQRERGVLQNRHQKSDLNSRHLRTSWWSHSVSTQSGSTIGSNPQSSWEEEAGVRSATAQTETGRTDRRGGTTGYSLSLEVSPDRSRKSSETNWIWN